MMFVTPIPVESLCLLGQRTAGNQVGLRERVNSIDSAAFSLRTPCDIGYIVQQSLVYLYLTLQPVVLVDDLLLQLLQLDQLRQHILVLIDLLLELLTLAFAFLNHLLLLL